MDINPSRTGLTLLGDAHFLPFRDKIMEKTFCKSVLEHVRSPVKVLLEMRRTTTGSMILVVPNVINLKRILRTLRNPLYEIPSGTLHLQGWDSKEIRHLASQSGLRVLSIKWDRHPLLASHMIVKMTDPGENKKCLE